MRRNKKHYINGGSGRFRKKTEKNKTGLKIWNEEIAQIIDEKKQIYL
jgi:hypothetical protein